MPKSKLDQVVNKQVGRAMEAFEKFEAGSMTKEELKQEIKRRIWHTKHDLLSEIKRRGGIVND